MKKNSNVLKANKIIFWKNDKMKSTLPSLLFSSLIIY